MAHGTAALAILRNILTLLQAGDLSSADKLNGIGDLANAYRLFGLKEIIVEQCGLTVQSGPFEGMKWLERAAEGSFIPKLLGAYELELHGAIDRVLVKGHCRIVNIGCAEGYYAVGLARAVMDAEIYAFDIDDRARALCAELAALNDVSVVIEGLCDQTRLQSLAGLGSLVICDIEGAEVDLLDPNCVPALAESDLLVELHPIAGGGETGAHILPRFEATHKIEPIPPVGRDTGAYPALAGLSQAAQLLALMERTEPTSWVYMTARA